MSAMLKKTFFLLCIIAVVNVPCYIKAGDDSNTKHKATIPSSIYVEDRISLEVVSGALFSPIRIASQSPKLHYAQTNLRLGWMLNSPPQSQSFLRGNYEAILELSNSIICKGFGNYIGGITALIRYNLVHPDSKFIPYFQCGVGIVYTDAYKDYSQNSIGQAIEFTPQVSLGFRYLLNKSLSINAEAIFHHISNAGLSDRNRGINAGGGFIGLTYFYDRLWKSP